MKVYILIILGILSTQHAFAKLEAHEWGTFTSLVGSNGITQNGMNHEDEKLPEFVHPFGELRKEKSATLPDPIDPQPCPGKICLTEEFMDRNIITQKMETPVIYFYSDKKQKVDVNVQFPDGIVTETFPGPVKTYPTKENITSIGNGNTTFSVDVLAEKTGALPYVSPNNIYSHARNVASNIVESGAEKEKFIFYRGIGRFQPKISITSENGNLLLSAMGESRPQAAFLVHVDSKGHGQMLKINGFGHLLVINQKTLNDLKNHDGSNDFASGARAKEMLVGALKSSGLNEDEASSMVNTWENGYLKVPGLRLLYILPRHEVDQLLPLKFTPTPDKVVRSFVGRIEILLDTEEKQILNDIKLYKEKFNVESLGRFAEPILRRVSEIYVTQHFQTPEVRKALEDLIEKVSDQNFATTAVH